LRCRHPAEEITCREKPAKKKLATSGKSPAYVHHRKN
jgi:hypothetical protein